MSNLLEKASIVTTPTAYENGKILSVKPTPSLSSELVVNGDFATDSNWTKGAGVIIANSKLTKNDPSVGNTSASQSGVFTVGKTYKYNLVVSGNITASNKIVAFASEFTSAGTYEGYWTATSTSLIVSLRGSTNVYSIDNVSVKQEIDGDFDFTRNSSATRVNSQGLIEDVQILSSNLVSNGDFSQEGSELITNGDFSNGVNNWAQGSEVSSFTVTNGIATIQGNASSFNTRISQSISVTIGKTYKITGEIKSNDAGDYRVRLFNGSYLDITNGNNSEFQTFTYYHNATTSTAILYLSSYYSNGSADFSIDNVSVKEVGQDWTVSNGTITDKYNASMTAYQTGIRILPFSNTGTFKVTFDLVVTSGSCKFDAGGSNNAIYSTSGTKELIATNITKFEFNAFNLGWVGTLDNVSVIEITDDTNLPRINYEGFSYQDALGSEEVVNGGFATDSNWNKSTGWSISGGTANSNDTNSFIYQNLSGTTPNDVFKVTYTISNYVSGNVAVGFGSGLNQPLGTQRNSNGTYTEYLTKTSTSIAFGLKGFAFIGSIDNVSVKEVLGQEVVPNSGCGSWLLEPQSTNIIPYSEDFSQSNWIKQASVILTPNQPSPDGGNNAYKVQGTIGSSYVLDGGFGAITPQSRSIYMRAETNGVIYSLGDGQSKQINVTTEWQRFEFQEISNSFYAVDFRGSGVTLNNVYIWGAQLEQNSYATSYIPTNGSTVTRLQDAAFGAGSSDLINSTEGVLYAEIAALADDNSTRVIQLSDGTNSNRMFIGYWSLSNEIRMLVQVGGVTQAFSGNTSYDILDFNKIAFKYKESDFALWINGTEIITDTSGVTFPIGTLTQLDFDSNGSAIFFGKTKCVAVFKEALTDAELTCLTTI